MKNPKIILTKQGQVKEVFKYGNKEYELTNEVVKHGCQGCAFISKLDCASKGRTNYCRNGKIFILHLKSIDE